MGTWIMDEAKADLKTGRSSAKQRSSIVEAVAAQSRASYAVQSYNSEKGFRGTVQCSSNVRDFSTRG